MEFSKPKPKIKRMKFMIALLIVLGLIDLVQGAVVISELSFAQANSLKPSAVFHYTAQAGGTSGANSKESILRTTSLLPDEEGDVTYTFPDTLVIQADASGNLAASLGSGSTLELPVVDGYNAILIQVYNYGVFIESVVFEGITLNGFPVRDLFAQGGYFSDTDQILIYLGTNKSFVLSGDITMPVFEPSSGSSSMVEVWGVTTIPEPSIFIFTCSFFMWALFFRNKNF